MGYLVLARKYRPQVFADMTGQEHVVQTLSNALRSGRVAHALLFCGPRGCGKTTTARIVAKALNCERGPTPEPCGVCTPCVEIAAGTDVDVQEIDAASNTGVDNVRDLRESAKYLPARDRFKIFIVDEVHMLSKAAFNAFLKTLEEPPGHVKFLFATTDPQALPDTILSRCQRHNFRLVPLKQISDRIRAISEAEKVSIDDGAVALVARQAAGSMRDSLSILDQLFSSVEPGIRIDAETASRVLGALDRTVVSDLAAALLARSPQGVLSAVARAHDGGHDLKRLAEELASHLRNLLAAGVAGLALDIPDHEIKLLREQSQGADPAELARLFDLVHGSLFELSRAAQPRHALEVALLKAVYLAPSTSIQSLVARADELARKLGVGPTPGGGGGLPPGGGGPRPKPSYEAPSFDAGSGHGPRAVAPAAPVAVAPAPAVMAPAPVPVVTAPPVAPAAVSAPPAAKPSAPEPAPRAPPHAAPAVKPWERHLSVVPGDAPAASQPVRPTVEPVSSPVPEAVVATVAPRPVAEVRPAVDVRPVEQRPVVMAPPVDRLLAERWPAWVDGVRGRRRALGSLLEHARPLTFTAGVLSIGFVRGDFHAKSLGESLAATEAILSELAGEPVRVKVIELEAEAAQQVSSIAESADKADREAREARMKSGREHPEIVAIVQLLGGEIEEVRDLAGGVA